MINKTFVVYCSIVPHNVPPSWLYNTAKKMSEKIPVIFIDLPEKPSNTGARGAMLYAKWILQELRGRKPFLLWNFAWTFSYSVLRFYLYYLKIIKGCRIVLMTTVPEKFEVYRHIPYDKICFDCTDQYYTTQFADNRERICSFDMVFTNTKLLFKLIKRMTSKVKKISSGYVKDVSIIEHNNHPLPKSVIFSGGISRRIDYQLLYEVAVLLPAYQFYFMGEIYLGKYYTDISDARYIQIWKSLNALPNVQYLGAFSPDQSRRILQLFSIGIVPYDSLDAMNYYSHPIKIYEYLAAGLPIVTTLLPSVSEYTQHFPVFVTNTSKEMAQNISSFKPDNSFQVKRARLVHMLQKQSLEQKIEQITQWLSSVS